MAPSWLRLHKGDCREVLRLHEDNSVDAVITDPPYGISEKIHADKLLNGWLTQQTPVGSGWDHLPGPSHWSAIVRTLKPGAFAVAFGSPRTFDILTVGMRLSGLEIVDSIAWLHNGGFPKNRDLGEGRGTALRPSFEPIIVAKKPTEGTLSENLAKWGTGGINIQRTGDEEVFINRWDEGAKPFGGGAGTPYHTVSSRGRWPRNVVVDEQTAEQLNTRAKYFYCVKVNQGQEKCINKHPTQKPLELMKYLCELFCPSHGVVLDPFMGSGTTGIAARDTNRRFIGIETEKPFFDLAMERLSEHSN